MRTKRQKLLVVVLAIALTLNLLSGCTPEEVRVNEMPQSSNGTNGVDGSNGSSDFVEPEPEPEPFPAKPFEGEIYSRAAIVINADTGDVVFSLNEHERLMPASTLKMMTLLVALEELEALSEELGKTLDEKLDMEEQIGVPLLIWGEFETDNPNTVGGSMSGIVPFQNSLTYRHALHALMLSSGNEVSNVIAYNLGGRGTDGISNFVDKMNSKVNELGLENTLFANAHGLHEYNNWASVYDLAEIARYGHERFSHFGEISGTFEYFMPANQAYRNGYRIRNSNSLIRGIRGENRDGDGEYYGETPLENEVHSIYFRESARGVKTGGLNKVWHMDYDTGQWYETAGIANLVSRFESYCDDGYKRAFIIATLEAPWRAGTLTDGMSRAHYALTDHITLYEWLFQR